MNAAVSQLIIPVDSQVQKTEPSTLLITTAIHRHAATLERVIFIMGQAIKHARTHTHTHTDTHNVNPFPADSLVHKQTHACTHVNSWQWLLTLYLYSDRIAEEESPSSSSVIGWHAHTHSHTHKHTKLTAFISQMSNKLSQSHVRIRRSSLLPNHHISKLFQT